MDQAAPAFPHLTYEGCQPGSTVTGPAAVFATANEAKRRAGSMTLQIVSPDGGAVVPMRAWRSRAGASAASPIRCWSRAARSVSGR